MRFLRLLMMAFVTSLALVSCSGPSADPVSIELTVPEGGLGETIRQDVPLGAPVTMRVTTGFDDEVHVHGYELHLETVANETAELTFDATMAGTYEVESHTTDEVYMLLIVR
ncbi:MAG: hypothetical protein R2722_02730 [Tessaracoccus sp.]